MKSRHPIFILLGSIVIGIALFRVFTAVGVTSEGEYVIFPSDSVVKNADVVVAGRVKSVGESRWNQENGRLWEGDLSMMFHLVEIEVTKQFAGDIKEGETFEMFVGGNSPSDVEKVIVSIVGDGNAAYHEHLYSGDEVIIFAEYDELHWSSSGKIADTTFPVIAPIGGPIQGVMRRSEEGVYSSQNMPDLTLEQAEEFVEEMR